MPDPICSLYEPIKYHTHQGHIRVPEIRTSCGKQNATLHSNSIRYSAKEFVNLLPRRPIQPVGPFFGKESFDIHFSLAGENIHVPRPDDTRPHVQLVADVHDDDNGRGQIRLEKVDDEITRRVAGVPDGPETGPELRDQHEDIENQADPRPHDAHGAAEREFVERVAL